ncbi:MAG: hypothetical protein FWH51_05630 [Dehalococcoidia bacterium]|nr:hypothetical protein [Dehalococcoidia bacterium]
MTESDTTHRQTCSFCKGKGRVAEDGFDGDDTNCPVCQGEGTVLVDNNAVPHQICDGSGKIKMRGPFGKHVAVCPDCRGTGWIV